ncbi:RING-H2 finger protein ATL16-like [Pistacia vera]|uniref:RING-H2 finger protein ATL16-like n=1 Tax=Pistacia vera TaxID=55513 RepID=UPI0012634B04|nr:RING-H2 finger protein ATL16-like [Pistacia vera]
MSSSPSPAPIYKPPSWNPLVVSLVALTCTIFLLFSYYNYLKKLCCCAFNRGNSRNPDQRQLLNEANFDDPSLQFNSHGLESSIIHSLPITQFKKNINKEEEEELQPRNSECGVCLGEFEEGEWLKHLPNCSHAFHIPCIDTWFHSHSNCPLCRSQAFDLTIPHECSVSMYTLLENLRREDFFHERATHYQILRTAVLQSRGT